MDHAAAGKWTVNMRLCPWSLALNAIHIYDSPWIQWTFPIPNELLCERVRKG